MATKKTAKKAAPKKAATKKAAAPKVPFYAQLLSKQEVALYKATNKENDSFATDKYPNDDADVVYKESKGAVYTFPGAVTGKKKDQLVVTLKYPSDSDEDFVTQKYPSDGDDIKITQLELEKAQLKTTRYPSDNYNQAVEMIIEHNSKKRNTAVTIKPTKPSLDVVHTMKYPSDGDETVITF